MAVFRTSLVLVLFVKSWCAFASVDYLGPDSFGCKGCGYDGGYNKGTFDIGGCGGDCGYGGGGYGDRGYGGYVDHGAAGCIDRGAGGFGVVGDRFAVEGFNGYDYLGGGYDYLGGGYDYLGGGYENEGGIDYRSYDIDTGKSYYTRGDEDVCCGSNSLYSGSQADNVNAYDESISDFYDRGSIDYGNYFDLDNQLSKYADSSFYQCCNDDFCGSDFSFQSDYLKKYEITDYLKECSTSSRGFELYNEGGYNSLYNKDFDYALGTDSLCQSEGALCTVSDCQEAESWSKGESSLDLKQFDECFASGHSCEEAEHASTSKEEQVQSCEELSQDSEIIDKDSFVYV